MSVCLSFALLRLSCSLPASCSNPHAGSQHHVDKALNLIGKKFKELNLTNIYAPPLPSLALPSLPMTSWVSMLLGARTSCAPFPSTCPEQTPRPWLIKAKSSLMTGPSHCRIPWSVCC